MTFALNSSAFEDGKAIPKKYTRDGANLSPPLEWSGAPDRTQSYALIIEDPDAPSGMFRHWAIYNIKGDRTHLPEGIPANTGELGRAVNDFGNPGYDGPEPPRGHGTHHYHFRMAALDTPTLNVPQNPSVTEVWEAAKPHIIDQAELVGTYAR